MTVKENVLMSYPDAKVLYHAMDKPDPENDKWNGEYYLIVWEEQSILQFMRAYAKTEEAAWQKAWESIQREMLVKLENL
jgi:hypothetical protein